MDDYCAENKCANPNVKRLPRVQMPQFTRKSVKGLDARMRQEGYKVRNTRVSPNKLNPSQLEISQDTAEHILKKWGATIRSNAARERILVSRDGSILDGHHRWLALVLAMQRGILPKTYKAPVHSYSAKGGTTLKIARTMSTPSHA